ncbi:MAG TPA: hypothetical protein VNM16_00210 [Bacillota bacterium]|nr:hypothetical protein [Bacillota bacterium]
MSAPGVALPVRTELAKLQRGAWVEVLPGAALTYGQQRAVERAARIASEEARTDAFLHARLRVLVGAWSLRTPDGQALAPPAQVTQEEFDRLQVRVAMAIHRLVAAQWNIATAPEDDGDPNAPSAP